MTVDELCCSYDSFKEVSTLKYICYAVAPPEDLVKMAHMLNALSI